MDRIVEVEKLTKEYGIHKALNKVSFTINKGQVLGLIGPNGSGKSTTIKLLLGVEKPTTGNIKYFGVELGKNSSYIQHIGVVLDKPALYEHLTAYQNLELNCLLWGIPKERILNSLEEVGLLKHNDKLVKEFSFGMKQRLSIANALIRKPSLLILDEPSNGLDAIASYELKKLIRELSNNGVAILVVSHQLNDIETLCDSIVVLVNGKVILRDAVSNICENTISYTFKVSDLSKAVKELNNYDKYSKSNNTIEISLKGGLQLQDILNCLTTHNIEILDISKTQVSLESTLYSKMKLESLNEE